ncbi:hypothetical protein ACKXGF_07755 [Alkalibacillus sp. S2W]|uniref:hypothetical protein n=1 Tax=Alkalibacillus sp. S2W TaxID=3386553 RepID=UPI00398CAE82
MRKFYAYVLPKSESEEAGETAVGIEEYSEGKTRSIHSLYINEPLSHKRRIKYVLNYVNSLLADDERAKVQAVNVRRAGVKLADWEDVLIYEKKYREKDFEIAKELCNDALERKGSVRLLHDEME